VFIWKKEYKAIKEKADLYSKIQNAIISAFQYKSEYIDAKNKNGSVLARFETNRKCILQFPIKRVLELAGI
jgi:hypothetical protein